MKSGKSNQKQSGSCNQEQKDTKQSNLLVNSINAGSAIDAGIRFAFVFFRQTLPVVIAGGTVASVGIDEVFASAAIVARIRSTLVDVLLAVDAFVSADAGIRGDKRRF